MNGINIICHQAALGSVPRSIKKPLSSHINNVNGFLNILIAAKESGIKRVVYASSSSVYGDNFTLPKIEEKTGNILSPYAATKAGAELIAQSYVHSFNMPIIITRGNNVYGPRQYPEKVNPRFISQLMNNEKITIQGDGSCVRGFLHVFDTANAFVTILKKGQIGQIYNIGCDADMEYSVMDIAKLLIKKIKHTDHYENYITYIEDRPFNDKRYYICNDTLKKLGWNIHIDFEDGIDELIKSYMNSN